MASIIEPTVDIPTIPEDLIGGLDTFPPNVFLLNAIQNPELYIVDVLNNIHGLACFSTEYDAIKYLDFHLLDGNISCRTVEVSFEDAREIAHEKHKKHPFIVALYLRDYQKPPKIHYIV